MSAWYLFSAMGFYPGQYDIGKGDEHLLSIPSRPSFGGLRDRCTVL
jgi:hypothetical protein